MKPLLSTFCALLLASAVAGQGLRTDLVVEGLLTQARVVESADGEQSWFVPGENELEFAWSSPSCRRCRLNHLPFQPPST